MTCIHPGCRNRQMKWRRGLCMRHYNDPAIRAQHPVAEKRYANTQTDAELDALIAERMKCLPSWWSLEARKVEQGKA